MKFRGLALTGAWNAAPVPAISKFRHDDFMEGATPKQPRYCLGSVTKCLKLNWWFSYVFMKPDQIVAGYTYIHIYHIHIYHIPQHIQTCIPTLDKLLSCLRISMFSGWRQARGRSASPAQRAPERVVRGRSVDGWAGHDICIHAKKMSYIYIYRQSFFFALSLSLSPCVLEFASFWCQELCLKRLVVHCSAFSSSAWSGRSPLRAVQPRA